MKRVSSHGESTSGRRTRSFTPTAVQRLHEGARAWRLGARSVLGLMLLPFAVALIGASTALVSKDLYKWFTGEDRFAETLQALFYCLAFALAVTIVRRLWMSGRRGFAFLYLIVCLGLFFMIGEELSWGQRLLGWSTPETFRSMNKQEETNLHNINGVGYTFKWLQLLVGAYGTLLPLLFLRRRILARYREFIAMTVPHFTLIPYFAMLFIWRLYRNLFEAPKQLYFVVSEYNEVMELILAMGFFLFMLYQIRRLNEKRAAINVVHFHRDAA